jgi:hypothetical protein
VRSARRTRFLDLRLDEGVVGPDAAEARRAWWAARWRAIRPRITASVTVDRSRRALVVVVAARALA